MGQTHLQESSTRGSQIGWGGDTWAAKSAATGTSGSLSQPKGQVDRGKVGLVRFSGTDGQQPVLPSKGTDKGICPQSYHLKLGYSQEFLPVPRSGPRPCGHLPRSPGLRLSEAGFRLDPRSGSFMGLQVWVSWLEGRLGWQPWGSREGLRAPGPRSLGPWLRSRPLFSKG